MAKTQTPRQVDNTGTGGRAATVQVVPAEAPSAYYTNNTAVETSLWDIRLRFAETVEVDKANNIIKVKELASVRMSPQHARVVFGLLKNQLENYEKQFGPIPAPKREAE